MDKKRIVLNKTLVYPLLALLVVALTACSYFVIFKRTIDTQLEVHKIAGNPEEIADLEDNFYVNNEETNDTDNQPEPNVVVEAPEYPPEYQIDVPFMTQAPHANWDSLHEDACEEASLLIYKFWLESAPEISKDEAESEILKMVSFEESSGIGPSITLRDLAQIARNYLNISGFVVEKAENSEAIKRRLFEYKSPIIVGAAGRQLLNPNFRNGGPNYHMLVITGYKDGYFVTNDPGTRNGEEYTYREDVLYSAIHDWNSQDIALGEKNIMYLGQDL